jgi:hypothetical protein
VTTHPSEAQVQGQVVEYLDLKGLHFTHPPNGGLRDKRTAAKLRWQGTRPGVPDLLVFEPWALDGKSGIGIAIEMKSHVGRPTPEQRAWIAHLESVGWLCGVCRTFDAARVLVDAARRRR